MKAIRHVIHLVPTPFDWRGGIIGGAERYAFELARYTAKVVPTTLVSFGEQASEGMVGELRVKILKASRYIRGQKANPWSSALFATLRAADVIHCHQQHVVASSAAAAYARLTGRRVVVSDLGGGGWDISAYLSTDRWYHAHLHISEYSRAVYGHAGLARAQVILGGIDTEKFSPDPAVPRERMVLFVGRLLPHKGVNDLIEALPVGLRLEIIGQPYDEKFYQHLQHLAKGREVVFRHQCDDVELVQAYRRCLCVVLPSVYQTWAGTKTQVPELLGQTLLEGMACGAPGIGTDVASLPEVVVPGQTGFIVPPNNPAALRERLQYLADHPDQAATMGQAARQRVLAVFQWPKVVERCLASYRAE